MLAVDRDALAAGEFREIDAMSAFAEAQVHTVVYESFAFEARADAGFFEQVNSSLFQDASAHAFLDVLPAAIFEHYRLDAVKVQKVRQNEACWSGSDDSNLRAHILLPNKPTQTIAEKNRCHGTPR